jgi:hypothetical protein
MANITYPDKIVGSQYLNTEANQVKEVVNTNASRLTTVEGVAPTSNQKAALAGTHGSPSGSNRYVTDGDPRLGALSNPKAIFFPVDDLAELKAIDTTEAEQAPDKWLILVKDLGVYYLDRISTETPDDSLVVEPTAGPGRWIRETRRGDGGGGGPAIAAIYDDITDMIAAQGDQEPQAFYRVNDSTAAGLTGYSTWEYLGTTGGVIADYRLESAEEYLQEALLPGNNLSDVSSVSTSRTNLDVYSTTEVDNLIPEVSMQAAYDGGNEIELDGVNNLRVLKNGGLVTVFELDQGEQALILEGKSNDDTDYSLWIVDDLGNTLLKVWNDGSSEFGGDISSFLEVQPGITSGNAGIQFPSAQSIGYRLKDDASFDYVTIKTDTGGVGRAVRIRQKLIINRGTGFESYIDQFFTETSAANSGQNIIANIPVASGFMAEVHVMNMAGRGANGNVISADPLKIIARNVAGTLTGANTTVGTLRLGATTGAWNVNYNDTTDEIEIRLQNESTGQIYSAWVQVSIVIYPTS